MPSAIDEKTGGLDDTQDSPSQSPSHTLSHITMHVYTSGPSHQQHLQSKRHQVKNACTNCRRACKKCDDARPCFRCVRYGISDNCVDSPRKQRPHGVKRGPYKRKGKSNDVVQHGTQEPIQTIFKVASPIQPSSAEPVSPPPFGHPQGFYLYHHHHPPIAPPQSDSVPVYTPPYFLTVPQFQPCPESRVYVPQGYYPALFSSVYCLPGDGHVNR